MTDTDIAIPSDDALRAEIVRDAEDIGRWERPHAEQAKEMARSHRYLGATSPAAAAARKIAEQGPSNEAWRLQAEFRLQTGPGPNASPYAEKFWKDAESVRRGEQRLQELHAQLEAITRFDAQGIPVGSTDAALERRLVSEIETLQARIAYVKSDAGQAERDRALDAAVAWKKQKLLDAQLVARAERRAAEMDEQERIDELARRIRAGRGVQDPYAKPAGPKRANG